MTKNNLLVALPICLLFALVSTAHAEHAHAEQQKKIVAAVERGVAVVEKAGRNYPTHRKCFACHHQTLPLLAISEARAAGAKSDAALPAALAEFTATSFRGKLDDLRAGENIGGKGLTVGYGLWTLRLAESKPDDLTEAMVAYLLKTQEEDGRWDLHAIRPPAEESLVMCTVLAAGGVRHFASEAQRASGAAAVEKARAWLANAKLDSHEDQVARLWGVKLLGGKDEQLAPARATLLDAQREDGGWGQTAEMESDAYATGTALFVLLDTGLTATDPKLQRGVEYLLQTQLEDGSWHVRTRAKPVQVFFDNGDPHGKDQFISISATGWSVAALSRAIGKLKNAD
ncbi:MAG: prenyltransferase/squalene oxidase repeat-containing protein [Deltaproteobacteria bacterium]